jgi:hypothetical protein
VSEDLKIKAKVEDCLAWSYVALRQFPKHERHVLAAEIRTALWQLLRLVVACNRRYYKKTTLQDLDVELDLLRSQVRLAHDLRYIDIAKYETWARQLDEIGRMVGGWLRSQRGGAGIPAEAPADPGRELEQRVERGRRCPEPEQLPGQREHEHRLPPRSRGSSEGAGSRAGVQHTLERAGTPRPGAET